MTSARDSRADLDGLDPRRLELLLRLTEADRRQRRDTPAAGPAADAPIALSLAQERLWLAEQLDPGNLSYNLVLPLRIRGSLDRSALSAALDLILARHDALRTTIASVGGRPYGRIDPPPTGALQLLDLRGLEDASREAAVEERMARHVGRPFDLEAGPLYRMELIHTDDSTYILILSVHHIAADNVSLEIFCRELEVFYAKAGVPEAVDGRPPLSYAAFAERQRAELGADLDRLEHYWGDQLRGIPRQLDLPLDRARPEVRSFRGARTPFALPASRAAGFKDLQARNSVTPFMVMLAGFFVVLQRYCGQDDLVVGTDVASRSHGDLEDIIGFFANQLVMRVQLEDNPTAAEALRRVKRVCLEGYRHQDLPFQHLVGLLGRDRDASRSPVFQVKLAFLRYKAGELDLPGVEVSLMPAAASAKFDIEVTCWSTPEGAVDGFFEYATDLFFEETMQAMSRHLGEAVSAMCVDDTQRVLEIALGTEKPSAPVTVPQERFRFED